MSSYIVAILLFILVLADTLVTGCLITNCPRGGKRNSKFSSIESNVKPCVSCGPGHSGQCFGPNICCGPFGCLMGTPDSLRCLRDGYFHDREPCIAGNSSCMKNTGRCAAEGICCNQESCFTDKTCTSDEKHVIVPENVPIMDLYNLINYQAEMSNDK